MNNRLITQEFSDEQEEKAYEEWKSIDRKILLLEAHLDSDYYSLYEDKFSLLGDDRKSQPFNVSSVINLSLITSIDYVAALRDLVFRTGSLHIFAPQALARSTIETAAIGL